MKTLLIILSLAIYVSGYSQTYRNPNKKVIKVQISKAPKTSADHLSDMQKNLTNSFSQATANYVANASAARAANIQREKNRLAAREYSDIRQKNQAIEIALNPKKAFDYGKPFRQVFDKQMARSFGFSKGTVISFKIPNKSLFATTKPGQYINESEDEVVTEIEIIAPHFPFGIKSFRKLSKKEKKKEYKRWQPFIGKSEKWAKSEIKKIVIGEVDEKGDFYHKTDINKAKVWGNEGFSTTLFYENDYEYVIKDNFYYISPKGVIYRAGVRYRGDKDEVTFEMLQGRRSYLKKLCALIIATARLDIGKKGLNWKQ